MYRFVQPIKVCDGKYSCFLWLFQVRLRQIWRRRIVPVVRLQLLIAALVTDKAAGDCPSRLHVPAILVMLPALMGAVQRIALLGMFMYGGRIAVRRGGRVLIVKSANQLVGVTVPGMLVLAWLARFGLHVPARFGMFRVVFTYHLPVPS